MMMLCTDALELSSKKREKQMHAAVKETDCWNLSKS